MIPCYSRKEMFSIAKLVSSQCMILGSSVMHWNDTIIGINQK
ncbi:hypothetical protein [Wolbachia endosymbiont of Drosophila simulans]|nr:hypothetical protein [Wolbachia endosymbiont of Drosophila simulans]